MHKLCMLYVIQYLHKVTDFEKIISTIAIPIKCAPSLRVHLSILVDVLMQVWYIYTDICYMCTVYKLNVSPSQLCWCLCIFSLLEYHFLHNFHFQVDPIFHQFSLSPYLT